VKPRKPFLTRSYTAAAVASTLALLALPHFLIALDQVPPEADPARADSILLRFIQKSWYAHPDLDAMNRMTDAVPPRGRMTYSWMNPEFRVGVMGLPVSFDFHEDEATAVTFGVGQKIPFPGKNPAARRASDAATAESRHELLQARSEMAAMTAMAYYDLAGAIEQRTILEQGRLLIEEMIAAAQIMTASGMSGQSDIQRARLELQEWQIRIFAAEGLIGSKRAELAYAVGAEDLTEDELEQVHLPSDFPRILPVDSLLERDVIDRTPVVRNALATAKVSELALKRAQLEYYPDVELMLNYDLRSYVNTPGGIDEHGEPVMPGRMDMDDMISVELSFPLPLWRKGNQDAQVEEMRAMHRRSLATVADARLAEIKRIRELHVRWKPQADCCEFVRTDLLVSSEALYKAALADYRSGKADLMALTEARMKKIMAEMEWTMSLAEVWALRGQIMARLGSGGFAPDSPELSRAEEPSQ